MAGVTGPTSFSATPNPFDTALTLSWSGVVYSGLTIDRGVRYYWRSSPDNATWSGWQGDTIYYTTLGSASISVAVHNVPYGSYVQYLMYARGYTSGNKSYSGPAEYTTTRTIRPTACGAHTAGAVNAPSSEGHVPLSLSGADACPASALPGLEDQ